MFDGASTVTDISAVLDALAVIEKAILVDDGTDYQDVKRVYEPVPQAGKTLEDTPCWINTFTFHDDVRGPFGVGTLNYTVTAQLFVAKAAVDITRSIRVGRKLHAAFIAALRANETLSGSATAGHTLRGADPTEAIVPWAGIDHVAYVHLLEVPLWESAEFGLGM